MAGPARPLPALPSKWDIREKVWEYLEASGLAEFPRPVRGRIPNFKGSLQACSSLGELDVFSRAREVKVDPDKPLEGARLAALQARKTLLVPTPRLRTGLFNRIVPPPGASKEILRRCATSQGVKDYSVPVGLDGKAQVDLVVVGSVAVSEKGWRIGKGEGYADMEYAMMVSMGAVREDTPVVTIVHDCQVLDIAEELLGDHDLTVDYILTPTRTIQTNCKRPKPQGIMWHKVSSEMLGKIPILRTLRSRERQAGKDVTLQDEHPALANTNRAAISDEKATAANSHVESDPVNPKSQGSATTTTVYVGNLPGSLRVSELKSALRELQVIPVGLKWQGAQHRAFLDYSDRGTAHRAVSSLQGLSLGGNALRAELARSQRSRGQGEISRHK
ncbi:methenyltetrahydrofolate synthase domain-containing protein isoform X1 [Hirundo rustica]|uniref:methenyltetrahydrofolate synthase domain-containing protein isoform X1 n=1 Tax=Hirundo rustica TaxID=43150 RepID=UPI001A9436D7|nr:methenyltetrahydrofolate synthase domain-containing protein isoform X1 [Hirundo rustica]